MDLNGEFLREFFPVIGLIKIWLVRSRVALKAKLPEWPKNTTYGLFNIHIATTVVVKSMYVTGVLINKIMCYLTGCSLVAWAWESNIFEKYLYALGVPMILTSTVYVEWSKDNAIIIPSIPGPKARKGNRNKNIKRMKQSKGNVNRNIRRRWHLVLAPGQDGKPSNMDTDISWYLPARSCGPLRNPVVMMKIRWWRGAVATSYMMIYA